jgi:pSer/pThr/pTyr-binding forkhead associated (FHA) protein
MTKCSIRVADSERIAFQIETPLVEGCVIGRSDENAQYVPDIDLAPYDSREKGVSRRHAALVTYHGQPHIIDLFSVNGTYLDGHRLPPDQPHPLGQVNELRLGMLDVIITLS